LGQRWNWRASRSRSKLFDPILSLFITPGRVLIRLDLDPNNASKHILIFQDNDIRMLRLLATLAFAASFDILLFDGKYISAVDKVAVAIIRSF
jgi:hypothetical protein